jgi:hypothetical protein
MPPLALFLYHPICQPKSFTHQEFEDSMIGQGMRTFNSFTRVSPEALEHLNHILPWVQNDVLD